MNLKNNLFKQVKTVKEKTLKELKFCYKEIKINK